MDYGRASLTLPPTSLRRRTSAVEPSEKEENASASPTFSSLYNPEHGATTKIRGKAHPPAFVFGRLRLA